MKVPHLFIGIPTYNGKNYCLEDFSQHLHAQIYPKDKIMLLAVDNSPEEVNNHELLSEKHGIPTLRYPKDPNQNVLEALANSHNKLRERFLETNLQWFLHLESDVILNDYMTLFKLVQARKKVISPIYNLSNGANRHIIQRNRQIGQPCDDYFSWGYVHHHHNQNFLDGTVKRTQTNGLGCLLMHRSVVERVPFRYDPNKKSAPDSSFTKDLVTEGISAYCETSTLAFHYNTEDWGIENSKLNQKYNGAN